MATQQEPITNFKLKLVGEVEDEPPKHICPLSQQPCDEDCSWGEKSNCEFYQGLSAGRAERKIIK